MSEDMRSHLLGQDMQMRLADGDSTDYAFRTEQAVEYVAVANEENGILGYLWACDVDSAAGWESRRAVGAIAMNSSRYWYGKLREAKTRGLVPSEALSELSADTEGGWSGHVVPGSRAVVASVAELRELAQEGWTAPDEPRNPRGRRP
ncbi:hypothetical protein [Kitasatospora purpeofusca]|uniref:Uncharacterized protein n=1 Tax=Kitasatospora purpeofusca TaxID=67352 RepID=A0ABZ1U9A9_9ACTN|nr:hypothetical protein [Kitasatospora purpeofusca]